MSDTASILQRIKDTVQANEPGATVILYGSYARGDQRPDSDIDVLILADREKVSYDEEKKITYPLYNIEFDTGVLISPLVYPKTQWESRYKITPLYKNVVREGIAL